MKTTIGTALVVIAIYLAFRGITEYSNSTVSVDVVGIEMSAQDNGKKNTSIIFIGLAVLSGIGGVYLLKNKK